ncbi:hypothetical protein SAY87_028116 [Trapa incisa]|uniref:Uncharacterized protein n=1 Tax=Trapa incisa TaxID=236973 RepID=A0AAN7KTE9_9MYRT|nr:hypothetical protein SAY87_028116 [Trapa incisa]
MDSEVDIVLDSQAMVIAAMGDGNLTGIPSFGGMRAEEKLGGGGKACYNGYFGGLQSREGRRRIRNKRNPPAIFSPQLISCSLMSPSSHVGCAMEWPSHCSIAIASEDLNDLM